MTPQQRTQAIAQLCREHPGQTVHEFAFEPDNPQSSGIVFVGDPPEWFTRSIEAVRLATTSKKLPKSGNEEATER